MNPFSELLRQLQNFRMKYGTAGRADRGMTAEQVQREQEFEQDLADLIMAAMEVCYAMRGGR